MANPTREELRGVSNRKIDEYCTAGLNEQVMWREWMNNIYVHQEKLRKVVHKAI